MDYATDRLDRSSSTHPSPVIALLRLGRNEDALKTAISILTCSIRSQPPPAQEEDPHNLLPGIHRSIADVAQCYDFTGRSTAASAFLSSIYDFTLASSSPLTPPLVLSALSVSPTSQGVVKPPLVIVMLYLKMLYTSHPCPMLLVRNLLSLTPSLNLPQYGDWNPSPSPQIKRIRKSIEINLAKDFKSHLAYYQYIYRLVMGVKKKRPDPKAHVPTSTLSPSGRTLVMTGDSHCLALSLVTLSVAGGLTCVGRPATGLKAAHLRGSGGFFTEANLRAILGQLGDRGTIGFWAGEIDCREGIGGEALGGVIRGEVGLEGIQKEVEARVRVYVEALGRMKVEWGIGQVLVFPVVPAEPRSKGSGRHRGREVRRGTVRTWNETLKAEVAGREGLFLVDIFEGTGRVDEEGNVVMKEDFRCDGTHASNAIRDIVAEAIVNSGCDLTLL